MPTATSTGESTDAAPRPPPMPDAGYVMPVLHTHVPAQAVELGFWGALAGAALLGAIDPPLALLVGAGVVIARHRRG